MRVGNTVGVSVVALGALLGAVPACSTLNTTEVQCLSEAECLAKGPAFANTTCSPVTKTCVFVDAGVGTCTTNQDCITANNNQPAICRASDKTCVVLQTPECPDVLTTPPNSLTQVANDDTIVLGYDGVMNSSFAGVQLENVVRVVQNEITGMTGMTGPTVGGKPRPVIWVACNEVNVGTTGLIAGANHLANEIQVPIIVGPYDSGQGIQVLEQVTIPAGTMVVAPTGQQTALEELPGNPAAPTPLYWRISGSVDTEISGIVAAVSDSGPLSQRLVDAGIKTATYPTEKTRMLLVEEASIFGETYGNAIISGVTLNGVSGQALITDPNFMVVSEGDPVVDPIDTPDPIAAASAVVGAAVTFKPHIIVYASSSPYGVPLLVLPIEGAWPTAVPGQNPPLHVATTPTWTTFFPPIPPLESRVFLEAASTPPPSMAALAQETSFFANYNTLLMATGPAEVNAMNAVISLIYETYDAAYFAEYTLGALGSNPINGVNATNAAAQKLAGGNGMLLNDDPMDIQNSLMLLSSGASLTINGLSGELNFDPKTGAPPHDAELYCINFGPMGAGTVASGYSYSATTNMPLGSISASACPIIP